MEPSVIVSPRVRGASSSSAADVKLDLQTLQPLFSMKQEVAAERLGICLTSLKSACRKLGIRRWPYSRKGSIPKKAPNYIRSDPPPAVPDLTIGTSARMPIQEGPSHTVSCPTLHDAPNKVDPEHTPIVQRDYEIFVKKPNSPTHQTDFFVGCFAVKREKEATTICKEWIDWYINSDDSDPVFTHKSL
mmetsp:Transcript_26310/g.86451  ORF Transcript_26310/g.86451 Transcript_26310/m.86451 type:complete len:188 (+) Transcript_26310:122-685(+)